LLSCHALHLLSLTVFGSGKDYLDQLRIIVQQLGMPRDAELGFITNGKARAYIKDMGALPVGHPVPHAQEKGKAVEQSK